MSDVFGAEDDTASGGLQTDMPQINSDSPAPRRMPSALDGLARMFRGGQAPQAAQPGRSPFQFPGQSQIASLHPGAQPGGPRWEGTTASLVLPQGSPQPRLNFTPFQRSLPTRDPSEWGQPEEFAALPSSFELPSIFQGVSQFFSQHGSQLSMPFARSLGMNSTAYIKGVMAGQKFRADMAREKMTNDALALQVQEEKQHQKYGDTIARYLSINDTGDYSKLTKGINGVSVRDALWNDANQLGDHDFANMIQDGASIEQLVRYQQLRDANLRDLQKANQKNAEQQEDDSAYTGGRQVAGPAGTSRGPLGGPTGPLEGATLPQSAPLESGQPAPTAAGGTPVETGDDSGERAKIDEYISKDGLASQWVKDYPNLAREVMARGDKIKGQMQALGGSGPSVNPSQVATKDPATGMWTASEKVKEASPQLASDLEDMLNYQQPAGGGQGGSGASPGTSSGQYGRLLRGLASKATKAAGEIPWNQNFYQEQRSFADKGTYMNTLGRVNNVTATGAQLMAAVDQLPDNSAGTMKKMWDAYTGKAQISDPAMYHKYEAVFNAWQSYSREKSALISGTGQVGMTLTKEGESIVQPWGDAAAYRIAIKQDAQIALHAYNGFKEQWRLLGGRPGAMPSRVSPNAEAMLRVLSMIDPADGTITRPNGKRWKFTGSNVEDINDPDNWVEQ